MILKLITALFLWVYGTWRLWHLWSAHKSGFDELYGRGLLPPHYDREKFLFALILKAAFALAAFPVGLLLLFTRR